MEKGRSKHVIVDEEDEVFCEDNIVTAGRGRFREQDAIVKKSPVISDYDDDFSIEYLSQSGSHVPYADLFFDNKQEKYQQQDTPVKSSATSIWSSFGPGPTNATKPPVEPESSKPNSSSLSKYFNYFKGSTKGSEEIENVNESAIPSRIIPDDLTKESNDTALAGMTFSNFFNTLQNSVKELFTEGPPSFTTMTAVQDEIANFSSPIKKNNTLQDIVLPEICSESWILDAMTITNNEKIIQTKNPSPKRRGSHFEFEPATNTNTPIYAALSTSTGSNIPFSMEGSLNVLRQELKKMKITSESASSNESYEKRIGEIDDSLAAIGRLVQGSLERSEILGKVGGCSILCQILDRFLEVPMISESSLVVLYWLLQSDINRAKLMRCRIVDLLYKSLERHSTIEIVTEWALKCICSLSILKDGKSGLGKIGIMELISRVALHYNCPENIIAVEWILKALFSLAYQSDDNVVYIEKTKLHTYVLQQMKVALSSESSDIILWCLRVIGIIALHSSICSDGIGTDGGCLIVIEILQKFACLNETVAESGLWAASSMCFLSAQNQNIFIELSITSDIEKIYHCNRKNMSMVKFTCIAIRNLCHGNCDCLINLAKNESIIDIIVSIHKKAINQLLSSSVQRERKNFEEVIQWVWYALASLSDSEKVRETLVNKNFVEELTDILNNFSSRTELCVLWMMSTIGNLAINSGISSRLGNLGCSKGIVECGFKYVSNQHICCEICKSIANLCDIPENRVWLGAANAAAMLTNMLKQNVRFKIVVERVLWASACLCTNNVTNVAKFGEAAACKHFSSAVLRYAPDSLFASEWGCKFLFNLSSSYENSVKLCSNSGCDALSAALSVFCDNQTVVEWGCKTIVSICSQHESNVSRFQNTSVVISIEKCLSHHVRNSEMMQQLCLAIKALAIDINIRGKLGTENVCEALYSDITQFSDSELVSELICSTIAILAEQNDSNCLKLGLSGCIDGVVSILQKHAGNVNVVMSSLDAISNLSTIEGNRMRLGASGACETVVSIFTGHSKILKVAALCCKALSRLSIENEYNIGRIGAAGGCEALISSLMIYHIDAALSTYCLYAISNISSDTENSNKFGAGGGCEYVITATEINLKLDSSAAHQGCMAIGSLCLTSESNAIKLGALGACSTIVTSLKTYPQSIPVVSSCCRAFYALASQCDMIERVHGCESFLASLLQHCKSDVVCEWGCRAIASMALDLNLKQSLVQHGACEILTSIAYRISGSNLAEVLLVNPENPVLANCCILAICSLCKSCASNCARFGRLDVCDAITRVLARYDEICEIIENVCVAILLLTADIKPNQTKFGNSGIAKVLNNVLHKHYTNLRVAEKCLEAVEALVERNEQNSIKMGTNGVCDSVALAMQSHHNSPEVARAGCGAVADLALIDANLVKLITAGACEAAIAVIQRYASDKRIAEKGFKAISNLALSKVNSGWLGPAGACTALISAMAVHNDNVELAPAAWRAVGNLCNEEGNIVRLGACGACDLLIVALRIHCNDELSMTECCRAFAKLAIDEDNLKTFLGSQACENLIMILQLHVNSRLVTRQACEAVYVLANMRPVVQHRLCNEGGHYATLDVLKLHGTDFPQIATMACFALKALCYQNSSSCLQISMCSCCDLLLSVIMSHLKDVNCCIAATAALWTLTDKCAMNVKALGYASSSQLMLLLLREHLQVSDICTNVIMLLLNITTISETESFHSNQVISFEEISPTQLQVEATNAQEFDGNYQYENLASTIADNIAALVEQGCCETLIIVLDLHMGKADLVIHVLKLCCRLAIIPNAQYQFGSNKLPKCLTKIMQIYQSDVGIIALTCKLIYEICSDCQSNKSKLGNAGICRQFVSVIQSNINNASICELCSVAVVTLSRDCESNRFKFVTAGAIDALLLAVSLQRQQEAGDASAIPEWASSAISALGALK